MKNYKDFKKEYIGSSDIASLILVGCNDRKGTMGLHFGEAGSYNAYIVKGEAIIGSHYHKEAEFNHWMKIYDDEEMIKKFKADKIIVYRAGDMGCIIQIFQ